MFKIAQTLGAASAMLHRRVFIVPPDSWLRAARLGRTTIVFYLLMRSLGFAQDVTEPALKAAFIYNFAKFTEWPVDVVPSAEPFVLCVLGDTAVGDALARAVKERVLGGHRLTVAYVDPGKGPQQVCHVLYVSGVTADRAAELVARLRDAPVLTISDLDGFTQRGGVAQFFFEQGRLRFNVQLETATRARLLISSRLLALSRAP